MGAARCRVGADRGAQHLHVPVGRCVRIIADDVDVIEFERRMLILRLSSARPAPGRPIAGDRYGHCQGRIAGSTASILNRSTAFSMIERSRSEAMPRTRARNSLPSIGRLVRYLPPAGDGIRLFDTGECLFHIAEGCHLYIFFTITISIFAA